MNRYPADSSGTSAPCQPLTEEEFEQFRRLAHEKFGLALRKGKESLVSARLGKKIRELNLRSFQDYYRHVIDDSSGQALAGMIDALSTNHTSFFREPAHFDFLRDAVLPHLRGRCPVRVWSAGCSTGEEAYSLLFCLLEHLGPAALSRIELLASDISTRALETARHAVYPAARFEGLPVAMLRKYLLRGEGHRAGWFRIKPSLRNAVRFAHLNLVESFPALGEFPVIFCRNVMIYFDRPTQSSLVRRLADRLEPAGYLFVGHSESLAGIDHPLEYVRPAIYRKPDGGGRRKNAGRVA
jgi:chemotaxis protein methyltransferase CheR